MSVSWTKALRSARHRAKLASVSRSRAAFKPRPREESSSIESRFSFALPPNIDYISRKPFDERRSPRTSRAGRLVLIPRAGRCSRCSGAEARTFRRGALLNTPHSRRCPIWNQSGVQKPTGLRHRATSCRLESSLSRCRAKRRVRTSRFRSTSKARARSKARFEPRGAGRSC